MPFDAFLSDHLSRVASQAERPRFLSGVFFDCHGTLFTSHKPDPLFSAFLRAAAPEFNMQPHIISMALDSFIPAIKDAKLHDVCTLSGKRALRGATMELLIDDEPLTLTGVSVIHPDKFRIMLEPLRNTVLKPYFY